MTLVAEQPFVQWWRLQNLYSGKCLETRTDDGVFAHVGTCANTQRQWWARNYSWYQNKYKSVVGKPNCLRGYPSDTVILDFCRGLNNLRWSRR